MDSQLSTGTSGCNRAYFLDSRILGHAVARGCAQGLAVAASLRRITRRHMKAVNSQNSISTYGGKERSCDEGTRAPSDLWYTISR
jgi:hypothetical protein